MADHMKLIWEFEYTLFQRTILRFRNVRGLSFFISSSSIHTSSYIRSVDLMSMTGVSDEYVASLNSRGISTLIDKPLIHADVIVLRDRIPLLTSNSSDKSTISERFLDLFTYGQRELVGGLAIEFDEGKELVLCHGIEEETFHDMINNGRSKPRAFVSVMRFTVCIWSREGIWLESQQRYWQLLTQYNDSNEDVKEGIKVHSMDV